jgi:hypothetical protein
MDAVMYFENHINPSNKHCCLLVSLLRVALLI